MDINAMDNLDISDDPSQEQSSMRSFLSNPPLLHEYIQLELGRQHLLSYLMRMQRSITGRRLHENTVRLIARRPEILGDFLRQRNIKRNIQQPRAWCESITNEDRRNLLEIMVQPIFSAPYSIQSSEKEILRQRISASLDEDEIFATAKSRTEYYHRLAERIWQVEMELEEKWLMAE